MAPKWPILVSWCEMDYQKPTILLIFGTLSFGGSWDHPMRPKLNLKDKGQMSKPNEYTDNFKSNLTCIFLSVRAKLKKKKLCPRTLCSTDFCLWYTCLKFNKMFWVSGFIICAPNFKHISEQEVHLISYKMKKKNMKHQL